MKGFYTTLGFLKGKQSGQMGWTGLIKYCVSLLIQVADLIFIVKVLLFNVPNFAQDQVLHLGNNIKETGNMHLYVRDLKNW